MLALLIRMIGPKGTNRPGINGTEKNLSRASAAAWFRQAPAGAVRLRFAWEKDAILRDLSCIADLADQLLPVWTPRFFKRPNA